MKRLNLIELLGKKVGFLTFIEYEFFKEGFHYIKVKCDCGVEKIVEWANFKTGRSNSCGCRRKARKKLYTEHPLYVIYRGIKDRCYNKNAKSYKYYGKRGVIMCEEWKNSYQSFYRWCIENGWHKGLEIDKDIKGNGLLYSPENCCIITQLENARTKRSIKLTEKIVSEIRGSTEPTNVLALRYNIDPSHVRKIINRKAWV